MYFLRTKVIFLVFKWTRRINLKKVFRVTLYNEFRQQIFAVDVLSIFDASRSGSLKQSIEFDAINDVVNWSLLLNTRACALSTYRAVNYVFFLQNKT